MPLTPNSEQRPTKRSGGGWGWLVPLFIAGPTIVQQVRSRTAGVLTDEQLLMIGAGVAALVALVIVSRRVWQRNVGVPPTPTYNPQQSAGVPQGPRFEPIITGKVMLAGLVLGALFALGVVALFVVLSA